MRSVSGLTPVSRKIGKAASASTAAISAAVIETLERRIQMDANYFALSPTSALVQNWSNTGLITTNNNWTGVPSIQGFQGTAFTVTAGANPEGVIANDPTPTQFVQANKTSPDDSSVNAGVAEFEINNPTVALSASGTAKAPYLQLYVNTIGVNNVHVSYNVRDLQAAASNVDAVEQLALQYRVGTSGNFTDVPTAYISDATDTGDTKVTTESIDLPAATVGQAQVQIRIMTTNASGTDEWIGIDDIVVSQGQTIAFNAPTYSVAENAAGGTATVTVTRSGDLSAAASVNYATVPGGTATAGSDYTSVSSTLNFAINQSSASFTIPITDDASPEGTETINLALTSPTGVALGTPSTAMLYITDDDVAAPAAKSVLLNEIDVNPPSTDDGFEYIELEGNTNLPLHNVYVVSVEGDVTDHPAGSAAAVFNLNNQSIGSDGLLLIKSPNNMVTAVAGTTVVNDPQLNTGVLENNTDSFLLVYSPTPITSLQDLDTDNDGALDLPAGAVLLDAVGWHDADTVDVVYGGVTLTQSSGTPDAATRFPTNTDQFAFDGWYNGDLAAGASSSLIYDNTKASTNFPAGGILTPGAANSAGSGGGAIGFSLSGYTVNEAAGTATITLDRINGSTGAVTVDYAVAAGGSATSPDDYSGGTGTANFADGQLTATFTISIVDDGLVEPSETINLKLSHPTGGATIGPITTATLTIYDNDGSAPSQLLLNEVDVNPPTNNDNPQEYIELRGTPNETLHDVYVAAVEGDSESNPGTVTALFDLGGVTLGTNGLLIIKAPDATWTPDAGTAVLNSTILDTGGSGSAFENNSISFLAVFSKTGITTGDDLDSNDDGTVDLPPNTTLLDGVGWTDGDTGDFAYGAVLTQSSGTPDAATRFSDALMPLSSADWYNGDLLNDNGNSSVTYDETDPTKNSDNIPASAVLTPGKANFGSLNLDTTPPTVITAVFNYDTASPTTKQNIPITFSEAIQTLSSANITLNKVLPLPSSTVSSSDITITQDSTSHYTLSFNFTNGALPDGQYQLVISGVQDVAGNAMTADFTLSFFILNADANHDGTVNALDFNAVAANYGDAGTFSTGDFDYSGTVTTADFAILVGQFGKNVPPPSAPLPGPLSGATLFGDLQIFGGDTLFGDAGNTALI